MLAQQEPSLAHGAHETRSIVAVVLGLLSVEFAFHQLGTSSLLSGLVALAVGSLAVRNSLSLRARRWIIISAVLAFVGVGSILHALGLEVLPTLQLPHVFPEPRQGLLALVHLVADFSVLGIGVYQLVRLYRLRNAGCGVTALASFTGCCGTTAVILTTALSSLLGPGVTHSGIPFVIVATVIAGALAAFAYASAGGNSLSAVTTKDRG